MPTTTMSIKSPSPILLLTIIITFAVAVTASPISIQSKPDFLILPSDDHSPTSLCPHFVNPGSCPIRCFRPDPVCGINNVTYWCGCPDAACAGVPVAKLGICDFENKGSGPVSGQALLLVHILWLILLGFFVLFGLL